MAAVLPPRTRSTPPPAVVYVAVLVGGMLGGTLRYVVGLAVPVQPGEIPWGVLVINVVGAFVLSMLLSGWVRRGHVTHPWRPFLATGVLGAFTTWSTFMADSLGLYRAGVAVLATVYLVGATAAGIASAGLGWWTAQRLVPHIDDEVPQ